MYFPKGIGEQVRVLTNNPLVRQNLANLDSCTIEYCAGALIDVLIKARDQVHLGYRLCTHPLSGSVKPNETPYKTIGLSDAPEQTLCTDSLMLIEHSIAMCRHLSATSRPVPSDMLADFQLVDLTLILSALEGIGLWHTSAPMLKSMPAGIHPAPLA